MKITRIGHNNSIPNEKILFILRINSNPMKALISRTALLDKLLDSAVGKKRKSVILTSDDIVVLSSLSPKAIADRFNEEEGDQDMEYVISVGHDNFVPFSKISMILQIDTNPAKRLVKDARLSDKLIDATIGKQTESVIVTTLGYLILSSISPATLAKRCNNLQNDASRLVISLGHNNFLPKDKIQSILVVDSRPTKDLIKKAKSSGSLIKVTKGRIQKSAVITNEGRVVVSSLSSKAIASKFSKEAENDSENDFEGE